MDYNHQETLKQSIDWYMNQCFTVTRLRPGQKILTEDDHFIDSYADAVDWVGRGGNLGFYPGRRVLVIDVDRKNGVDGKPAFDRLNLPTTRTIKTPSGGMHFYFSLPEGAPLISQNVTGCNGIDFLSANHNVVIPGSVVRNGTTSGCYELVVDRPVATAPDHLLDLFKNSGPGYSSDHDCMPLERVKSLCEDLRNDDLPYGTWFNVVAAIHYETQGSAGGMLIADEWSRKSDKHTSKRFDKSWHSLHRERGDNVATGATLVQMVRAQTPLFEEIKSEIEALPDVAPVEEKPTLLESAFAKTAPSEIDGVLKSLTEWIDSGALYHQPELCLTGALHCISAALKNRFVVGKTHVGMNFFSINVANTGKGKEAPRQSMIKFCKEFVPDTVTEGRNGPINHSACLERIASGPAVASALVRRKDRTWMIDEFGEYLKSIGDQGGHSRDAVVAMMAYYAKPRGSVGELTYSRAENSSPSMDHPYLSVMASTTPLNLAKAVSEQGAIDSGLINRAFFAQGDNKALPQFDEVKQANIPFCISAWIAEIDAIEGSEADPYVIPIDDDAWEAAKQNGMIFATCPQKIQALYSRAFEMMLKVAGLRAVSTTEMRVTLPILNWAFHRVTQSLKNFEDMYTEHVGRDTEVEARQQRIIDCITGMVGVPPKNVELEEGSQAHMLWMKGYVIRREMVRKLNATKWDKEALEQLIEQGRLEEKSGKNNLALKGHDVKMIRVTGL